MSTGVNAFTDTADQDQEYQAKQALESWLKRVSQQRERFGLLVKWHTEVSQAVPTIDYPYSGDDSYINLNVYEYDANHEYKINAEKTLVNLKAVAKFAASKHLKIKKDYDSSFSLEITISEDPEITVNYSANRDTVCTKKVVGTKVIPARTIDERVEEVIEWDCAPLSLLKD